MGAQRARSAARSGAPAPGVGVARSPTGPLPPPWDRSRLTRPVNGSRATRSPAPPAARRTPMPPRSPRRLSCPAMRSATGFAPGRINLIGEHTDYNDGLVMPIALRLGVMVAATSRDDASVRLTTDAAIASREARYDLGAEQRDGTWADRARGVTAILARNGAALAGFDAQI